MTPQVILKCKTDDRPSDNPTYTMLPQGWIVLHKINIPHWRRKRRVCRSRYSNLVKLLHVSGESLSHMQCEKYSSQNTEMGVGVSSFGRLPPVWVTASSPLQLVNMEGEFEGGPELQAHVLHHHVTTQQQEGFAVNLLKMERWDV